MFSQARHPVALFVVPVDRVILQQTPKGNIKLP